MKNFKPSYKNEGTTIPLPDMKKIWLVCFIMGAVFWIISLVLWWQQGIDQSILFYFNDMRIQKDPIIIISKWFSSYGMAFITSIFVVYLSLSKLIKSLDATLTVYFYTICSFGISGIAGDLLKIIFARPRPFATYGSEILAWSESAGFAIPSGHATKSIALILPFLLIVSNKTMIHKGITFLITLIAGGVCFSRILLGAHYLSDVIAGIGTALIGLPFSMMFANMVLSKAKQEQLPKLSLVWGFLLIFLTAVFMAL